MKYVAVQGCMQMTSLTPTVIDQVSYDSYNVCFIATIAAIYRHAGRISQVNTAVSNLFSLKMFILNSVNLTKKINPYCHVTWLKYIHLLSNKNTTTVLYT